MSATTFLSLDGADRAVARMAQSRSLARIGRRAAQLAWAAVFFVSVFLILSAPAQFDRLTYTLNRWLTQGSSVSVASGFSPADFLGHEPRVAVPPFDDNALYIPSIDVRAPILWDIPVSEALNGLQQGVVQVKESYYPGEVGRTFIAGHSSGYWWMHNPWTKVFALLDKVADGDLVFVKRNGQAYAYVVTKRETVAPDKVDVIRDEHLDHNQLALMTCTPVGTSLNRLVLYAEPVATESGTASPSQH